MDDGEALKRIAPPFIPERKTYYFKEEPDQARAISDPPTYFTFHWTGSSFQNWGLGFGDEKGMTIRQVLGDVLELKSYQIQLPQEYPSFKLPGDWMLDVTTEMQPKLDKLADIIRDAKGPSLKFSEKEIERPVLVAQGKYAFHPIDGAYEATSVHLFIGKSDKDEGAGGGSGLLDEFLKMLGDRVGMPVANEVEDPPSQRISWRHHSSTNYKQLAGLPEGPAKEEKIKQLLEMVSKQTDLKLTIEQRKVSVWVAEPAPAK